MQLVLAVAFCAFLSVILGLMARRAWSWTEPPELSLFNEGAYAAALPACLMATTVVIAFVPIAILEPRDGAPWARIFALAFLIVFAALAVAMYTAFTYRRPRRFIPPALRRPPEEGDASV
jgi:hypothetical protein